MGVGSARRWICLDCAPAGGVGRSTRYAASSVTARSDAERDAYPDATPHPYTYAKCDGHSDPHLHAKRECDAYQHAHSQCDCDGYSRANRNRDVHPYAYEYAIGIASRHPNATSFHHAQPNANRAADGHIRSDATADGDDAGARDEHACGGRTVGFGHAHDSAQRDADAHTNRNAERNRRTNRNAERNRRADRNADTQRHANQSPVANAIANANSQRHVYANFVEHADVCRYPHAAAHEHSRTYGNRVVGCPDCNGPGG